MQERERLLREAFARYEAGAWGPLGLPPASYWRGREGLGDLVNAVRAFCAAPASEVGENDAATPLASGGVEGKKLADKPGPSTQAATPTSPAAPPERESAERCQCGAVVMERWCGWYGDAWGLHTRKECVPATPLASAPPEAAAETCASPERLSPDERRDKRDDEEIAGSLEQGRGQQPAGRDDVLVSRAALRRIVRRNDDARAQLAEAQREIDRRFGIGGELIIARKRAEAAEAALATLRAQVADWADDIDGVTTIETPGRIMGVVKEMRAASTSTGEPPKSKGMDAHEQT